MDSVKANYNLTLYGLIFGSVVSIIAAFSKCFLKSRCSKINTPCISCDRDVLDDSNSVYEDSNEEFKPITSQRKM